MVSDERQGTGIITREALFSERTINQRIYICCWREKCRWSRICLPAREICFFR